MTQVPITFLPSDPQQYEIGAVDQSRVTRDLNETILDSMVPVGLLLIWLIAVIVATRRDIAFGQVCNEVDGVVNRLYPKVVQGRYGPTTYYWLNYSFSTGEEHFSRDVQVDLYYQNSHSEGGKIPVLYDPVDPSTSRIQREMRFVSTELVVTRSM